MNSKSFKKHKKSYPYYTIGHSNRPISEFINILVKENINLVVDVRSLPGSNKNPQYNKEGLVNTLKLYKIKYKHVSKLGGLRINNPNILFDTNSFWINKSFHNYADYAMSEDFKEGFKELIELGSKYRCVIMCAEVLWWRCHRRIITDYLLMENKKVYHIFNLKNKKEAFMTNGAIVTKIKTVVYPSNNNFTKL